jgi:hypothetical protein
MGVHVLREAFLYGQTLVNVNESEVAVVRYSAGNSDPSTSHRQGTRLPIELTGSVRKSL